MGVRAAMNDFGTGTCSLASLGGYRFDSIKVDKSLISNIGRDPLALAVVQAAIHGIGKLGLVSRQGHGRPLPHTPWMACMIHDARAGSSMPMPRGPSQLPDSVNGRLDHRQRKRIASDVGDQGFVDLDAIESIAAQRRKRARTRSRSHSSPHARPSLAVPGEREALACGSAVKSLSAMDLQSGCGHAGTLERQRTPPSSARPEATWARDALTDMRAGAGGGVRCCQRDHCMHDPAASID